MERQMNKTPQINSLLERNVEAFQELLVHNLYHTHGQAIQTASKHDAYVALCYAVRDFLVERARRTIEARYETNPKVVYYLSAEYLLARMLHSSAECGGDADRGTNRIFAKCVGAPHRLRGKRFASLRR